MPDAVDVAVGQSCNVHVTVLIGMHEMALFVILENRFFARNLSFLTRLTLSRAMSRSDFVPALL